jgi:hypothetical protein
MKMKIRLSAGVCLLALLLTGCKFQADTRIRSNGSGELRTEVGFSAQERENLENQNPTSDFCNTAEAAPGVRVTEELRGDETWCVTVMAFEDLDELARFYEARPGLQVNRLEIVEGRLYYDVAVDTASESSNFAAFESVTWSVSLPAAPAQHNAHQADGATLTWNIAPRTGTVHLRAESPTGAGSPALPWLLGAALAVALLLAAGIWLGRSAFGRGRQ